jgi:hypothetical protein
MVLSLKQQLGIHLLLVFLFCFECRDCSGGARLETQKSWSSLQGRGPRGVKRWGRQARSRCTRSIYFLVLAPQIPVPLVLKLFGISPTFSYSMMLFSSLVAAVGFLAAGSQARYVKRDDGFTIFSRKAVAKRAPSEIVATTAVLPLMKKAATGASAARRQGLSKLLIANGSTTTLTSLFTGEEFAAEVEFGTQTFEMIVDTGSSDTWVVETGFVCTDLDTGKTTTEGI